MKEKIDSLVDGPVATDLVGVDVEGLLENLECATCEGCLSPLKLRAVIAGAALAEEVGLMTADEKLAAQILVAERAVAIRATVAGYRGSENCPR